MNKPKGFDKVKIPKQKTKYAIIERTMIFDESSMSGNIQEVYEEFIGYTYAVSKAQAENNARFRKTSSYQQLGLQNFCTNGSSYERHTRFVAIPATEYEEETT